ncbi:radical SAM/SPASM domain-containing protein [Patescibacteria group bacterium]
MIQKLRRLLAPYYENFFSFWPAGFSPFPTNVMFELLYGCNLSCPFCYLRIEETVKKIKAQKMLLTDEVLNIIDQIPSMTSISFSGGEIMLHKDVIKILKHAKKKHRIGIISNLTVNTKQHNQDLIDMKLDTLMTSLDGYNAQLHDKVRGKGSFQKTINNLKDIQLKKKKANSLFPTLTINSMILPNNLDQMEKMVKLASKLKVDWLNFQLIDPSINRSGYALKNSLSHLKGDLRKQLPKINQSKLKQSLAQTLKLAKKLNLTVTFSPRLSPTDILNYYSGKFDFKRLYCNRIFHLTRISPFGDLYPCFNLKIGSLLDTKFMKLWNSKKYRQFRSQIKNGAYKAQCVGCCHLRFKPEV